MLAHFVHLSFGAGVAHRSAEFPQLHIPGKTGLTEVPRCYDELRPGSSVLAKGQDVLGVLKLDLRRKAGP